MRYSRHPLDDLILDEATQKIYDDYVERFGTERKRGIYRYKNFPRFSYALGVLPRGGRVLDVGVFTGQFLDILTLSGKFDEVVGIDIVKKPGFHTLSSNYNFQIADCRSLPFADNSFDSVVCMEVLEHLEVQDFPIALAEVRRVCMGRLIVSVPYNEQPPLSRNHRQAFDDDKINSWFKDAKGTILTEHGKDIWVMLEENPSN
jgi:2-polyprenyl-3-methyl-5-hydroxy-6-metoxy-1,4-benzoquinol methylase